MRTPQFQMSFDLGNEAFDEPDKRRAEVARIIRETAGKIADGATGGVLFDVNGNSVGNWGMDPVVEELDG